MNTIELTKGFLAKISPEDYAQINRYLWCAMVAKDKVYAARRPGTGKKRKWVLLHRWLLDAPDGLDVDHINGDPLDNRRENLRVATRSQNTANSNCTRGTVRLRGVSKRNNCKSYRATITKNGKSRCIGHYPTADAAHQAYLQRRVELFGEFSPA